LILEPINWSFKSFHFWLVHWSVGDMNFMKSHSLLCSFLFCHQHAIGKFVIHSLSPCYVCVLCF